MYESKKTGYPSVDKPWLKYYTPEAIAAELPECTMYEYIRDRNKDNLTRVAMNYYGTDMTYGEMFQKIDAMAGALEAAGVAQGEIVTVCMVNAPETVCLMFALNKIGAVVNMVYGADTVEELRQHVQDAHSTLVFTLDMYQDKFAAIADETGLKKIVVTNITESMAPLTRMGARVFKGMRPKKLPVDPRFYDWKRFFAGAPAASRTCRDGNAPAVITYTGGTTGGSKGVVLSSRACYSVGWHLVWREKDASRDSLWLQAIPLFTAYGATCSMMIPLAIGMTQVIRIPMAESIAELCKKFPLNYILYGPLQWEKFADSNEDLDLSGFVLPTAGGDVLQPGVESKVNDYLQKHGCQYPLINGYGMTEAGAAVAINFLTAHKFQSVGVPLAKNVISAFDEQSGEELPCGQEGEICIHGPSMMLGYLNQPQESEKMIHIHKDGLAWVHSGDLGYVDQDGFVYIRGRLKRYIVHVEKDGYKKIFCLDIEKALLQHPKVANCVAVPLPDEATLNVPAAYVILKKEYRGMPQAAQELAEYARQALPPAYRPARYFFVEEFPLTKIGKVDYRALEERAKQAPTA